MPTIEPKSESSYVVNLEEGDVVTFHFNGVPVTFHRFSSGVSGKPDLLRVLAQTPGYEANVLGCDASLTFPMPQVEGPQEGEGAEDAE